MAFDYTHYEELEYIQSDGTQIINTDILLQTYGTGTNSNFEINAEMAYYESTIPTDLAVLYAMASYHSGGAAYALHGLYSTTSSTDFVYSYNSSASYAGYASGLAYDTNKHTFTYKRPTNASGNPRGFYIDGDNYKSHSLSVSSNYKPVAIFGRLWTASSTPDSLSKARLYKFTIIGAGSTVSELVPARRLSDNKIGVYDTVREIFITSEIGNDFTYQALPSENNIYVYDNGTWKKGKPYVYDNGTWKTGKPYVYDNGTWKS